MPNWPTAPPVRIGWYSLLYIIYFRNADDAMAVINAYTPGPNSAFINKSPDFIRGLFNIADTDIGADIDAAPVWLRSVNITGAEFSPYNNYIGNEIRFPVSAVPPQFYNTAEDWWIVNPNEFGSPVHSYPISAMVWSGLVVVWGGTSTDEEQPVEIPVPISKRRWATGFNYPFDTISADGIEYSSSTKISRDASRTSDGYGIAYRSENFSRVAKGILTKFGAVINNRKSWERMYLRLRKAPTAGTHRIWETNEGNGGSRLNVNSAGALELYRVNEGGVGTLINSMPLVVREWIRVDLLINFISNGVGTDCALSAITNNTLWANGSGSISLVSSIVHTSSYIGNFANDPTNDLEIDICDWHNAEYPSGFTSADWIMGSHVQYVKPTAFGTGNVWTGNFRTLLQKSAKKSGTALTSIVSGARLEADTELDGNPQRFYELISQIGCACFTVNLSSNQTGATDGQLGYKIGATADVLVTIDQLSSISGYAMLYSPTGMILPNPITPLKLIHTKSANVSLETLQFMGCSAQFIGWYGPEDNVPGCPPGGPSERLGIHNSPYPFSLADFGFPSPPNFYGIEGGIYNGNSTGQDISLTLPNAHWIFVRNITNISGWKWWSSLLASNEGISSSNCVEGMVDVFIDTDFICKIRIQGSSIATNQTGQTYQYIAISDQAMRFMINGAFKHTSLVPIATELLADADFTPEAAFFFGENYTGGSVVNQFFKGAGHAVDGASVVNGAEVATNHATFGLGTITTRSALNNSASQNFGYSAFRQLDFSSQRGCYIGQYIGNGAADRDIPVLLNGCRPFWAYICPMNAQAWIRDPSHLLVSSSNAALSVSGNTAIKGGDIDIIKVGITLNANGIVYSVLAFPGSIDAGNGGWSTNGMFESAAPGWPDGLGGPQANPAPFSLDPNTIGSGGLILNGGAATGLLLNVGGIYTLVKDKANDTLYDRQPAQTTADVEIPKPHGKLGFIGG